MDMAELISLICAALDESGELDDLSSDNDNESGEIFVQTMNGSEFIILINEI